MKKLKLIDEAGQWYRMFSQRALLAIVALQGMLATFPSSMTETKVPFFSFTWGQLAVGLTVAAAVIGFFGRLIDQNISQPPKDQP